MKYADIETEYKVLASTTNILKNEALYKLIYEMNETISELRKRLDKVDGLGE